MSNIEIIYEEIKDNKLYIKKGECKRCGKCCYYFDKLPSEGGKRIRCGNLIDEKDGTFSCKIYETRPDTCKEFPIYPYRADDIEYYKDCGYYFEVTDKLTYAGSIEELNKMCSLCNKYSEDCPQRLETINEITIKSVLNDS